MTKHDQDTYDTLARSLLTLSVQQHCPSTFGPEQIEQAITHALPIFTGNMTVGNAAKLGIFLTVNGGYDAD